MAKKKAESTAAGSADAVKADAAAGAPAEASKDAGPKKAAAKKPAAAKGGAKKAAAGKKDAAPAGPAGSPLVDTNLAAQNAARMLAARAKLGNAVNNTGGAKESASFKQMKESLNKGGTQGVADLSKALGPQKTNLPVKEYNQIFHNQTQGGVARLNLPRRTGG